MCRCLTHLETVTAIQWERHHMYELLCSGIQYQIWVRPHSFTCHSMMVGFFADCINTHLILGRISAQSMIWAWGRAMTRLVKFQIGVTSHGIGCLMISTLCQFNRWLTNRCYVESKTCDTTNAMSTMWDLPDEIKPKLSYSYQACKSQAWNATEAVKWDALIPPPGDRLPRATMSDKDVLALRER